MTGVLILEIRKQCKDSRMLHVKIYYMFCIELQKWSFLVVYGGV